ncbi:hypothetical protein HNP33_003048 [Comamonas odontotermitis]|uniref:Tip attachment protein J central straight fiber domain-containing protein n=1 Tax=Comamonas odontotermitis TaxID=379895 RepID=A0ABR6RIG0_9BURK|nr:DUF1983 domain-containing protein [Comamonas odontotermitis]MBB6578943.1 hypothetical protein [Comamonas odontotermitis]
MTAPNSRHQGVPAISQTALNAVADPNVRKVLQDMATGMNVRNGTAGDGNQQFITRAELKIAGIDIASATETLKKGGGSTAPQVLKPGDVPGLLNKIQDDIRNSLLWKELGERIELIKIDVSKNGVNFFQERQERVSADAAIIIRTDQQYAVLNGNYALLQQKYTTMATDISAYAQLLTDLQVKVGQNTALIQQETSARATADGQMMAKYTIKVDLNGHVSGFGLMSEANNGATVSTFIVRADRFAIGSPNNGTAVPFVVYTTPRNLNGQIVQPGVYIESAVIADGTITTAKIGLAQVDTLLIAGNAVTVPVFNSSPSGVAGVGFGTWINVVSLNVTMNYAGWVYVHATGIITYGSGFRKTGTRLLVNGGSVAGYEVDTGYITVSHAYAFYAGAGTTTTVTLQFEGDSPSAIGNAMLYAIGAKR